MKRFIAVSAGLLSLAGGAASTASAQDPRRGADYVVVEPPADARGYYDQRTAPPGARGYYDPRTAPADARGYYDQRTAPPGARGYYDPRTAPPGARGYYDPRTAPPGARGYYDPRDPPRYAHPGYDDERGYGRHGGYHGGAYGRAYLGDARDAALELAESADHLAEAARASGYDWHMIRDAYEFAEEADHFARLVTASRDPRVIEQDFYALADEYQRLRANFGRHGRFRQSRHVEDDFDHVRHAFHATADSLRAAYAYRGYDRYQYDPRTGHSAYYRGVPTPRYDVRFELAF